MDYSFFDGLIDAVFVIGEDRGIVYCNESAAKLCDSSVRRLAKGKPIYDTIEFSDPSIFTMPNGDIGRDVPAPYVELRYNLKSGKSGKVQLAIQPFTEPEGTKRWAVMLRDVTLEEVLHAKYHKQLEEKEVYIQQLQDAQKQLENYSKNLEQMVEERTLEVKRANQMLSAIMNSLGQGFFVFDSAGQCGDIFTRACEDILETDPSQKKVWDVLRVPESELQTFNMWLKAIYSEALPFDSIKELGPSLFRHSQDRHVKLDYFPLREDDKKISNVVVVATDSTSEYLANRALEKEKRYAKMVVKLVTSKKQFVQFLDGLIGSVDEVSKHIMDKGSEFDHEFVFRVLHTLEGEAATYSASEIWSSARAAQELLEPLKRKEDVDREALKTSILSALSALKKVYHEFLAENRSLFSMLGIGQSDKIEIRVEEVEALLDKMNKEHVPRQICNEFEDRLLRESLEPSFLHFRDVVSTVADKLNKKVKPLEFTGLETRVYLENYQNLISTFVHAYRNAVDHGLEPAEEREMAGKPAEGAIRTVVERFDRGGKWLRVRIEDDGGGISVEKIKRKLESIVPSSQLSSMTDDELIQQVFSSGLSTKEEVGEFSGRGIGMNAIKAEAERLGGRAWVESQLGQGTKLFIEIPDLPRPTGHSQAA